MHTHSRFNFWIKVKVIKEEEEEICRKCIHI